MALKVAEYSKGILKAEAVAQAEKRQSRNQTWIIIALAISLGGSIVLNIKQLFSVSSLKKLIK